MNETNPPVDSQRGRNTLPKEEENNKNPVRGNAYSMISLNSKEDDTTKQPSITSKAEKSKPGPQSKSQFSENADTNKQQLTNSANREPEISTPQMYEPFQ